MTELEHKDGVRCLGGPLAGQRKPMHQSGLMNHNMMFPWGLCVAKYEQRTRSVGGALVSIWLCVKLELDRSDEGTIRLVCDHEAREISRDTAHIGAGI